MVVAWVAEGLVVVGFLLNMPPFLLRKHRQNVRV